MEKETIRDEKIVVGWKEWCALPSLGLPAIKAKVDTGAKTSSLHAYEIETFYRYQKLWVKFNLHPIQRDSKFSVHRTARVVDQRYVMSSTGHKELRFVIRTDIQLGDNLWEIELTLANREQMMFRMLLGRDALTHRAIIDPGLAHHQLKMTNQKAKKLFKGLPKK